MKTNLLPCLLFLLVGNVTFSQITITKADMPQPGDTIRLSTTTDTTGLPAPAYTGAGVTWNYSTLFPKSQTIDTFLSVTSTPLAYQFFFNDVILYPAYVSTVAQAGLTPPALGPVTIKNVINYYKDENSNYESVGYGANINSIPTSVKDDAIDVIYNFPMNYGNADSCNSSNHVGLASLAYYGQQQKRVNHIDGWGTLITPFGTFSALRVKTLIYATDSIYIDTFHFGFSTPQPEQIQYKWLANGQALPLLQINETVIANRPVYTNTVYRDKIHVAGITSIQPLANNIALYPNPALDNSTLNYTLSNNTEINVSLFSADGKFVQKVFNGTQAAGNHQLSINTTQLSSGIYLVKMSGNNEQVVKRLTVIH
ncbi:MAG TPA: T9SS type A sorting domain-containing protein [Bacteroidia bacterium]|jgi:hypothetical protein|nr:T9SS type A sorting domain-containing protein [Bacteroidia bacterium]